MKAILTCGLAPILGLLMSTLAFAESDGLPVGDGKISSSPKQGYVLSCQQDFDQNAPGASAAGDWLRGDRWFPALKPTVDGQVLWAQGGLTVSISGEDRELSTMSLPDHATGIFPVATDDDAYLHDRNPNRIATSQVILRLPASPTMADAPGCLPMGMIGVALSGAAIFNALDARGQDAGAHEIQDSCSGHPEHNGQYHYHGPSACMKQEEGLIGYALDGFGIYAATENQETLTTADLDACHGHIGPVLWDGKVVTLYHYHLTADYPYTLGCFMGTPVP